MLTSAILDRLVYHSTLVNILWNSYRTAILSKIADKNDSRIVHKKIGTIAQNSLNINKLLYLYKIMALF